MSGWIGWLVPVALCLLLGFGASFYLQRVRLPHEETVAGITALAGMRWRDFIHLVLAAMNARGYERVFVPEAGDESDYLLERDGQRWLLSSKHGTAYVLGSTTISEFAREIRMRGAAGGLLVTPGRFAPEAVALARTHRIDLLDGPALWPELRPLLPEAQRAEVTGPARAQLQRQLLVAWGVALLAGVVAFLSMDHGRPDTAATGAVPTPMAGAAPVAVAKPAAPAVAATVAPAAAVPTDPEELERRRKDVATGVSTLPGVDKALWSTQSTLLVYLSDELSDPMSSVCPLLERYDELAASRVQLQPPAGSKHVVRFLQCRAF
ncbi:MAG TPA: restriction endonuclease [Xanthomonadaceae bacterium]|nr:restriction endonuclease [Xanthomonadaceae bacterium]